MFCDSLLTARDGSVRVLCMPDDLNQELNMGVRAFAIDATGTSLAGWPVDLNGLYTGRVIGDELALFGWVAISDVTE